MKLGLEIKAETDIFGTQTFHVKISSVFRSLSRSVSRDQGRNGYFGTYKFSLKLLIPLPEIVRYTLAGFPGYRCFWCLCCGAWRPWPVCNIPNTTSRHEFVKWWTHSKQNNRCKYNIVSKPENKRVQLMTCSAAGEKNLI